MNEQTKVNIAKQFLALHQADDIELWARYQSDRRAWLSIYNKLEQGYYGDLEHIDGPDYQVEIDRDHSASGNPELFTFETELDRTDVDEIEFLSKEQCFELEQTRYWFSVCGTTYCVADTNGELQLLDHRGRPCRECDATDAMLVSLEPHYELHIQD